MYKENLSTTDNQFGLKFEHAADMSVFAMKNVINHYRCHSRSSPAFICYLDASNAFDRLNFWTLFEKLLLRQVPSIIMWLLIFWHSTQPFSVRLGSCLSHPFSFSNGVRLGGVLFPYLFNVYTDHLSIELTSSGLSCIYNNVVTNH